MRCHRPSTWFNPLLTQDVIASAKLSTTFASIGGLAETKAEIQDIVRGPLWQRKKESSYALRRVCHCSSCPVPVFAPIALCPPVCVRVLISCATVTLFPCPQNLSCTDSLLLFRRGIGLLLSYRPNFHVIPRLYAPFCEVHSINVSACTVP